MHPLPHHHADTALESRIAQEMPSPDLFITMADTLKLLSDPVRLHLFWILCHLEECVMNLAALLDSTSPAVSHHLKLLKDAGLIDSRRDGKEVYYRAVQNPMTELLHRMMEELAQLPCPQASHMTCRATGQVLHSVNEKTIRQIHDYLIAHLDQRITIEDLSREFGMNPTTLKATFKECYGCSIAAHVKEHRMEAAAARLRDTDESIGQIAQSVGYISQSKFSAAFQEYHQCLPLEYRRTSRKQSL